MMLNRTKEAMDRWEHAVADLLLDGKEGYADEQSDLLDEAALRAVRDVCLQADQKLTREILEATKSNWLANFGRTTILRGDDSFPSVLRDYYGVAEMIAHQKCHQL